MSFLGKLFYNDEEGAESVVLIDIAAESVGGAYVHYANGELPTILYSRRLPIEIHDGESHEAAMLRALKTLGDELIREGAPTLMRHTGSGSARTVIVSIDSPWQETSVRTEYLERANPFTLTKSMVSSTIEKTSLQIPGKRVADESIIGTILNGYETHSPYGKKVHRASIIILSSLIDEKLADDIHATLRGTFHTRNIRSIAGSSLRYQAMRRAFTHERDALILDATGLSISISLVRKGLFIALAEVTNASDERPWIDKVMGEFAEIAKNYPLPRVVFLLARDADLSAFQQALGTADYSALWLSDNPPTIVPVLPSHMSSLVRQTTTAPPDLQLLLMALYQAQLVGQGEVV